MEETQGLNDGQNSGSHVKISAASSGSRNTIIAVVAVVAVGGMALFYKMSASNDGPKVQALNDFRAAFAKKCESAEFAAPTPPYLESEFLRSDALQAVVTKQAAALSAGASCTDVEQALRTASFPLGAKH